MFRRARYGKPASPLPRFPALRLLVCVGFAFWFFFLLFIAHDASAITPDRSHSALDTSRDTARRVPTEHDTLGSGIRMLASLLAVLALIVGSVFLLKKVIPYKGFVSNVKHPVLVLSRISLGQKKSICLIRIADEILVIGLTSTNMSLLSKMSAEDYYGEGGVDTYEASAGHKRNPRFRSLIDTLQTKLRKQSNFRSVMRKERDA